MTEKVRATISSAYRWRLGLIGLVCLVVGMWFCYDGSVAYPRQQKIGREFQQFKDEGKLEQWPDHARQQGWSIEDPGPPKKDSEIYLQLGLAAAIGPFGLLYMWWYVRSFWMWIEGDDEGLTTHTGQRARFDQIESLDKRRWKTKGIAVVRYKGDGGAGRLKLDDWIYNRQPTELLLRAVESHLEPEQFIGGEPEPPVDAEPAEPAEEPAEAGTPQA